MIAAVHGGATSLISATSRAGAGAGGRERLRATMAAAGWAERWAILQADLNAFDQRWASAAASLGWKHCELFSLARAPVWFQQIEVMGLVPMLNGRRIITMTARRAVIEAGEGSRLSYYRWPAGWR